MPQARILDFLFDEENEDKLAAHGVTVRQVLQLLENEHLVVPNRKGRRGLFLVIGVDHGGVCIAVPVETTPWPDTWRPITA